MNKPVKVAVGLSGGVDSAVAAYLLKEAGLSVVGVFLTCWSSAEESWSGEVGCSTSKDRKDAIRVAKHLDIPIKIWNFEKEYKDLVIGRFFQEYKRGRTPNPDIWCNTEIKFGLFLEKALLELGVDYIATGHYARIAVGKIQNPKPLRASRFVVSDPAVSKTRREPEAAILNKSEIRDSNNRNRRTGSRDVSNFEYSNLEFALDLDIRALDLSESNLHLLTGLDESKDQSYFLYRLNQFQLSKSLFPLGTYRKQVIREIAKEIGLPNAEKPDSQGICFVGKVDLKSFLQQRIKLHPGEVVNTKGKVIGCHDGVEFYTIGQRHGFEITRYQGAPLYVIKKDLKGNRLVVGRDQESDVKSFLVGDLHWITGDSEERFVHSFSGAGTLRSFQSYALTGSELRAQSFTKAPSASPLESLVRIRHLGEFLPCQINQIRGETSAEAVVELKSATRSVAPGQHAVLYAPLSSSGYEVLGGGVIVGG